jgi:serine/threonine protein kinase
MPLHEGRREQVGRKIGEGGRYRLKRVLGRGISGAVWLAADAEENREVAIKLLSNRAAANPRIRVRLIREGERFGGLDHPNLVQVHGLGVEGERLFLVSEYVPGCNLAELLSEAQTLGVSRALAIARDVGAALEVAHEAGIVHRDLKPANIMIREHDGAVKVLDFGIAKDLHSQSGITRIGTFVGTPAYCAPEQIRGRELDTRADIYSLGVILYEMLTGSTGVEESRRTRIARLVLGDKRIPLGRLYRAAPRPVARLIHRMTRRSPDRRPASMREVATECERLGTLHAEG